jgi:acyl-CoA dehydrogenase-like protein
MTVNQMITLAEELERYLGDPHDAASRMPFERVLTFDEREEFPFELVGVLQRWGLHEYCLPEEYGGKAGDVELGFNLLRLAARRDPTAATALMLTDLAYLPAWIAGTDEQRLPLLEGIKNGTRTTVTSISLGAVDTAFRVTMDFATQREIFGRRVVDMPYTRRQLAECFADLMLADAMATGAVRGLQANPAQASVFSSIVKFFVPTLLERSMAQLSLVLGARIYPRGHPHYGIYQKMLRDALVAICGDGNTGVNLKHIALQLEGFLRNALAVDGSLREQAAPRVRAMFHVDTKLPSYTPSLQQLFSRGMDDVVIALPSSIETLRAMAGRSAAREADWLHRAADVADAIAGQLNGLASDVAQRKATLGKESAELFRLAGQYCAIHAAACAVHLAVHSAGLFDGTFPDGAVLLMIMERVWRLFYPSEPVTDAAVVNRVMEHVCRLHREHRLFSHWQLPLQASEGSNT